MVTHQLKISENKTTKLRSGGCECGGWSQTEDLNGKSTMQANYDIHVQLNKNRGNA